MKIFLKYPVRLGTKADGQLYPKGTEVFLLDVGDVLVKNVYPDIKFSEESGQVAVRFPDRDHMTIVHYSQIERIIE